MPTIPDECRYRYFVSYAHGSGYGQIEIGTRVPVDSFDDVNQFRYTICDQPNSYGLRPDRIAILNYILVSGPDDERRSQLGDFARWLLTLDDPEDPIGVTDRQAVNLTQIIERAREALGQDVTA